MSWGALAGLIAGFIALLVGLTFLPDKNAPARDDVVGEQICGQMAMVQLMAELDVDQALFGDEHVDHLGGGGSRVRGAVQATDRSGAVVRRTFECMLPASGPRTVTLSEGISGG